MGSSSSKCSICLIKEGNFPIIFTSRSVIGCEFQAKDVNISHSRNSGSSDSSTSVNAVKSYIQQLTTRNGRSKLAKLSAIYKDQQTIFNIDLDRKFLDSLCEILPDPVLQIKGSIQVPGKSKISFDNQLELQKEANSGMTIWDLATTQRLLKRNESLELHASCTCDISLNWSEPESTQNSTNPTTPIRLREDTFTQNLYNMESSKDLTIVVGNGTEIKCHRIIFQAHSTVLAAMISPENGMRESESGRIEMRENSEDGINRLLRYLYGMELSTTDLSCDVAVELFQTAHKYELTDLLNCLCELLLQKGKDWFTPDVLLELYFYVRNLEQFKNLQDHSQTIMLSMSKLIRSCERFQELNRVDALDLVWALFDAK